MRKLRGYRAVLVDSSKTYWNIDRIWVEGSRIVEHETVFTLQGKVARTVMQELNTALAMPVDQAR